MGGINMKKKIALLLVAAMTVASLVACGNSAEDAPAAAPAEEATEAPAEETEAPADQLFVRSNKTLKLTPGGVLLYNKLPHLLQEYNEIVEEARNANNGFEGLLRLGFLDIYDIQGIISPVVYEFQRKYPQIQVSIP